MKLKKCPVCNGVARLSDCFSGYWCECTVCGLAGIVREKEKDAVEFWNMRSDTKELGDKIKQHNDDIANCFAETLSIKK